MSSWQLVMIMKTSYNSRDSARVDNQIKNQVWRALLLRYLCLENYPSLVLSTDSIPNVIVGQIEGEVSNLTDEVLYNLPPAILA